MKIILTNYLSDNFVSYEKSKKKFEIFSKLRSIVYKNTTIWEVITLC